MTEKIISQKKKFICDKCGKETEVVEKLPEDWKLVMSGKKLLNWYKGDYGIHKRGEELRREMFKVGLLVNEIGKIPKDEIESTDRFRDWVKTKFGDEYSIGFGKGNIYVLKELTKKEFERLNKRIKEEDES